MKGWAMCVLAVMLFGCSGPDDDDFVQTIRDRPRRTLREPLRTLPWVSDFRLGAGLDSAGRLRRLQTSFAPGEPVWLSMQVNDVPRGTVVTTYWYGPDNLTLDLEQQTIAPGQQRLRFVQNGTGQWPQGVYRAEVWIGANKLQSAPFDIVTR